MAAHRRSSRREFGDAGFPLLCTLPLTAASWWLTQEHALPIISAMALAASLGCRLLALRFHHRTSRAGSDGFEFRYCLVRVWWWLLAAWACTAVAGVFTALWAAGNGFAVFAVGLAAVVFMVWALGAMWQALEVLHTVLMDSSR